jgi:hypothetical protein
MTTRKTSSADDARALRDLAVWLITQEYASKGNPGQREAYRWARLTVRRLAHRLESNEQTIVDAVHAPPEATEHVAFDAVCDVGFGAIGAALQAQRFLLELQLSVVSDQAPWLLSEPPDQEAADRLADAIASRRRASGDTTACALCGVQIDRFRMGITDGSTRCADGKPHRFPPINLPTACADCDGEGTAIGCLRCGLVAQTPPVGLRPCFCEHDTSEQPCTCGAEGGDDDGQH